MDSNIPSPPSDPTSLQLYNIIKNFALNEELQEYTFDKSLTKQERSLVHEIVNQFGFFSVSQGKDNERFTVVYKKRPEEPIVEFRDNSDEMKRIFVRDFKLPITIVESPYFEYFIDLYDPILKTKQKLDWFMEVISQERDLGHYLGKLQSSILSAIKSTTAYQLFISPETEKKYKGQPIKHPTWTSSPIYIEENSGKFFFSIDMKSANFTVMKQFDKEIVLGCDSWQQLIQKYTPYLYYHNCKHIRQVILGHLNTKRVALLIKWSMHNVLLTLLESEFKKKIYNVLTDEINIQTSAETFLEDFHELMKIMVPFLEIVHIEAFKLVCLHSKKKFFVKEIFPGIPEMEEVKPMFRCVSPPYFAMVFRKYFGMNEIEYDRKFMNEGFLATFDKSIFDMENKNGDDE